ncbi:MAG: AmmeMemoRadiSam system protein A [Ignavibacteriales bacterium]|nr:MAG: AmmeMemoRadiSam system protein A [Ignavibacteriales bacterium]
MNLTKEEKLILLKAARQSILFAFGESSPEKIDFIHYPSLKENAGAFVTLTIDGELRGCIGYIMSDMPLYDTISDAAMQAAFNDPRFPSLNKTEFKFIDIEISVLSIPVPISDYSEIEIGKHGLLLDERNRALLLPQVAVEHNYDRDMFLSSLCEKAGMKKNTWKERKLNIKVFTATIFSEKEMRD